MKYKLISSDFDGTLLNDEKKITSNTNKVLKKYKDNGYIIVGVTARNLGSVEDVCDINMFNYLILNNGCNVYDIHKKCGYLISKISKEDAKLIEKETKKYSLQIDYCSSTKYYISINTSSKNKKFIKNINNIEEIKENILRMNIFLKEEQNIYVFKEMINNRFKNIDCFIMQDSNASKKWLVLNPKGVNKATTLNKLGNNLKIKKEEMIFFGDSLNDLEVMESVGMSVAVENALEEVKEKAKQITLSNNSEGVATFLKEYIK